MKTPIFGPAYVSRSTNLADQMCMNLVPEVVETKTGKEIGALFLSAGLDQFNVVGSGPIRAMRLFVSESLLYVVSGGDLFTLTTDGVVTFLGTVTATGPVSMIDNGTQLAIFIDQGYLVPGGYPLTGGAIGAAGRAYTPGDLVYLSQTGGTQVATAVATISTVDASGGVTAFTISRGGGFSVKPTGFSQASTNGFGSGFTITAPTYGAFLNIIPITLPFANTANISATYQDGFGIINKPGSNEVFQSDLLDLSNWNALSFASADANSDNVLAAVQVHREIFLFKTSHTEVWVNANQPGFTFQRLDGVYIQAGIVAIQSLVVSGESLIWLARNASGRGVVVEMTGYQPKAVSTVAIDSVIQKYTTISDAIGYAYQQNGHEYYVLTFPSADETWVLDRTTTALTGVPMWHQRGRWDGTAFHRHVGNCYALFAGKNLIGDYATGTIYAYNPDTLTDNGAQRKWVRSWRAMPQPTEAPTRFAGLRLDMQTGVNVVGNPTVNLRWSDDGGHTWSTPLVANVGAQGQTALRVMFRRLGSTRRATGLDRVFEASAVNTATVAFPAVLIDAELQTET